MFFSALLESLVAAKFFRQHSKQCVWGFLFQPRDDREKIWKGWLQSGQLEVFSLSASEGMLDVLFGGFG